MKRGLVACLVTATLLVACGGAVPSAANPSAAAPPHAHAGTEHHGHGGHFAHRFDDAASWSKVFDDPARDAWQKPDEVIAALKLDSRARVADLGAGTGYFAMRLARRVPEGKVFAIDLEPDMVRWLDERAKKEGLANVVAIKGTPSSAELPEPVDLVLVVDTYHHIPDRTAYFDRLRRSLREGGRLAIVDYTLEAEMGPPKKHRIPPEDVARELVPAGYRLAATHTFLPNQYFVVFDVAK